MKIGTITGLFSHIVTRMTDLHLNDENQSFVKRLSILNSFYNKVGRGRKIVLIPDGLGKYRLHGFEAKANMDSDNMVVMQDPDIVKSQGVLFTRYNALSGKYVLLIRSGKPRLSSASFM